MEIEKLASQNPWWDDKEAIIADDKVKKVLSTGEKIKFALGKDSAVFIGPRQLGKTTALKYDIYHKIMKEAVDPHDILYYSFDTVRKFEEIADVLDTFAGKGARKFIYLDEVSFVEGWQRAIKGFIDSKRSDGATLYITGSSSINLRKELLPGRGIRFLEFRPLSFRRFLLSLGSASLVKALKSKNPKSIKEALGHAADLVPYFKELDRLFGIYATTGGYPDAIFSYLNEGKISSDLYDIHWDAFISDISKDGKSSEIATMVVYGVLKSYASKINLSSIARAQGIKSHVTVRDYIEVLEDLFVARGVFPMAGRRYVFRKERKIYFNDPFLYNMFAKKMNFIDKEHESKVVEGIVYNHLYNFINTGRGIAEPKTSIGFYSGTKEVDFVVGKYGFEVKWQNEVRQSDFPSIDIQNKIILTKGKLDNYGAIKAIPLQCFLALL